MKVSVCVTTFNEKKEDIQKLLDALNSQTLKPDEVIIVDGSTITNSKFEILNSKQSLNLKYKIIKGASRANGRNEAIKLARNEIIATTDVGCLPRKDWLEKMVEPLAHLGGVKAHPRGVLPNVVAGFYHMTYENNLQKAMRVFLGILPKNFDNNFMPSARSMAFTKSIWKKAGGFPGKMTNTAEDTLFNVNLIKAGAVFTRVKNAVVEWGTPETIKSFYLRIKNYAEGDGQAGIWWHPVKGIQSHNIKILSIYLRYAIGLWLLVVGRYDYLTIYLIIYSFFAFRKARIWGILLQIVSDFAVMAGFARGIIKRCVKI